MKYIFILLAIPLLYVSCSSSARRISGSAELSLDDSIFDSLFTERQDSARSHTVRTADREVMREKPVRPVSGAGGVFMRPVSGRILTHFNKRAGHEGVEMAARPGEGVRAASGGKVIFCGYITGLGNTVIIRHAFDIISVYGYLSGIKTECGRRVKKGNIIGNAGTSGCSPGSRVHFRIYINYRGPRDPLHYLGRAGG